MYSNKIKFFEILLIYLIQTIKLSQKKDVFSKLLKK
jgi:hypothetical protein